LTTCYINDQVKFNVIISFWVNPIVENIFDVRYKMYRERHIIITIIINSMFTYSLNLFEWKLSRSWKKWQLFILEQEWQIFFFFLERESISLLFLKMRFHSLEWLSYLKSENLPLLLKNENIFTLFSRLTQFSIFWNEISF